MQCPVSFGKHWLGVEAFEAAAGIGGGELPVDADLGGIAGGGPGVHFGRQRRRIGQAAVQTLAREHAELDFGDVEPAGVFGVKWNSTLSSRRRASAGGKVR